MPDLYSEALPVVVVPESTVNGPEVLFKSPLPVYVINPPESDGGGGTLPERLSARLIDVGDEDLDAPLLTDDTGWYFSTEFVHNPFGDNKPAFLEVMSAASGSVLVQRLVDVASGGTIQRVQNNGASTEWSRIDNVIE